MKIRNHATEIDNTLSDICRKSQHLNLAQGFLLSHLFPSEKCNEENKFVYTLTLSGALYSVNLGPGEWTMDILLFFNKSGTFKHSAAHVQ